MPSFSIFQPEYAALMANAKKGVVFFSIGSIVNLANLDERFRQNLIVAFGRLHQYQFILKIDKEDEFSVELAKRYSNIFTTSWAPQTQILR